MAVDKTKAQAGQTQGAIGHKPEELKSGGLIPERAKGTVTVRCMAPGGRVTAERLRKIADVAEKYGTGLVHLSVRMSPEVLHVKLSDVEAVTRELSEVGQRIASCGRRTRVPIACGGCEYNPNGLVNTQKLALEINERFFGEDHVAKFKISLSGCPIECMHARMADLGFFGQMEPRLVAENCTGCELCTRACQDEALEMVDGLPVRDYDNCISCGDCVKACPFEAMVPKRVGHGVLVGGKGGKHMLMTEPVAEFVPEEKIIDVVRAISDWYRANGIPGERIGFTIARVGIDSLKNHLKELIGDCLLEADDLKKPRWVRFYPPGVAGRFRALAKD